MYALVQMDRKVILFHYRLLYDIEYSSMYYIVSPSYLSILYVVCVWGGYMSSKLKVLIHLPLFPFGSHKFVSLHFFFF